MKRKLLSLGCSLWLVLSLVACNTPTSTPAPNTTPPPFGVLTDATDNVSLRVKIITFDTSEPIAQETFYAAELVPMTNPEATVVAYAAGLDPQSAPRANSDAQGNVVFTGLPPGRYGLAMYMVPLGPILLRNEQQEDMVFEVVAGKTLDLGTVKVLVEGARLHP